MKNVDFCYWLQGFFEISNETTLDKHQIITIKASLANINEPLGRFTQWLTELTAFFEQQHYRDELIQFFHNDIKEYLNAVFHHVIDHSYDTNLESHVTQKIHDHPYP